jgi:hypothetical protein
LIHLEKDTNGHLIPPERAVVEYHGLDDLGVHTDLRRARLGQQTDDDTGARDVTLAAIR